MSLFEADLCGAAGPAHPGLARSLVELQKQADDAAAERDALRAKLARVREMAENVEPCRERVECAGHDALRRIVGVVDEQP